MIMITDEKLKTIVDDVIKDNEEVIDKILYPNYDKDMENGNLY